MAERCCRQKTTRSAELRPSELLQLAFSAKQLLLPKSEVGAAVFFARADQEELLQEISWGTNRVRGCVVLGLHALISRRWSALHGSAFFVSLRGSSFVIAREQTVAA